MPKLMIVTHCWAVNKPLYAVLLRAQLSSLVQNPPSGDVSIVVCSDQSDTDTCRVVDDFLGVGLSIIPYPMQREHMWRRSIARDAVASTFKNDADLFWYADCDYLFGLGCLSSLVEKWESHDKPELIWPRFVDANADKTPVDEFCRYNVNAKGLLVPPVMEITRTKLRRAIGGVFITSSEYLKKYGYLPTRRWQRPPPTPFPEFRDDPAFREKLLTRGRAVCVDNLPGLYRLRHTEIGYTAR